MHCFVLIDFKPHGHADRKDILCEIAEYFTWWIISIRARKPVLCFPSFHSQELRTWSWKWKQERGNATMRLCNMRSSLRFTLCLATLSLCFFSMLAFSYNVAKWTQFGMRKMKEKTQQKIRERYRLGGSRVKMKLPANEWIDLMEPVCIYIVLSNVHHHFNNKHTFRLLSHKKYRILVFAYVPKLKTKRGIFSECDSHEFNWNIKPRPRWNKKQNKRTLVLAEELETINA